jgi:D-amino-acid dehydrogenase
VTAAYDAVVVGGGIVGAALTLHLTDSGARVLLVDAQRPGRATDAGAGILSPQTLASEDEPWVALGLAAGRHYEELHRRLGAERPEPTGYERCGLVKLAVRESDGAAFDWVAGLARGRGRVTDIAPDEAHAMVPVLGPVLRALYNPDAARVDGRQLRAALLTAATAAGAEVREPAVASLVEGARGTPRIVVDGADMSAGAVALCGGAWTPELAARFGVPVSVVPHRGQIVHLDTGDAATGSWPIVQPVLGYYLVPWPGGRVAAGATVEPEAGFDASVTAGGVYEVLRETLRVAPGLRGARLVDVRVGLRPTTPDDRPLLGRVPGTDRVFVATGHGANGLLLGPYSARLVADAILGREPAPDLVPFALDRPALLEAQ